MTAESDFGGKPPFEVTGWDEQRVPFLFNSPHSGRHYPPEFLAASRLDPLTIRRSEDAFVDELLAGVVEAGAPLMRAHFPRAYLDVNREPYELDPRMFEGSLPSYANVRSMRVSGGLGTIARIVADQQEIYAGPMPVDEALARIERLYKPYHATLRRLLAETHVSFGFAVLVDCHSMPSTIRSGSERERPDFIIGDRYGTSCHPALSEACVQILTDLGHKVTRNRPYAGGFITEHYGRPARGLHAIQVEINRGLYMDEQRITPNARFAEIAAHLTEFARRLFALPDHIFRTPRAAAE